MAVNSEHPTKGVSTGARAKIGANVAIATLVVVAIVAVLQAVAYNAPAVRVDMTSSGVNSLSDGSMNLLGALDKNVTLTSLYFKTDLEDEDQSLYRRAVDDLLGLYQSTNRSKIQTDGINPLSDHEKLKALVARLGAKEKFAAEIKPYQERVTKYKDDMDAQMRAKLQDELDALGKLSGAAANPAAQAATGQIEQLATRLTSELENARKQIDGLTRPDNPQFAAATDVIRTLYTTVSKAFKDIADFGKKQTQRTPDLPADVAAYLNNAGARFAPFVTDLEKETTTLQELKPPKLEDVLAKLTPNGNALLVETDNDAVVVEFSSVFPPADQSRGARARFRDRTFKGEQKLTSAILRATHKEQTAVVFVRYGGLPLFMPAFSPGQPGGAYTNMRQQLEDANFVVEEWDLKASTTQPNIDPKPTKIVYVVLKPNEPERGPMGQQGADPPFGEVHRKAVLDALGANGRALFIAGWNPGPFGPIPGAYEYNQYLKDSWGVGVENESLLIEVMNTAPGRYNVGRRDFFLMRDPDLTNHPIVDSPLARVVGLPWCAPLVISEKAPENVTIEKLIVLPKRDGVWAVKNIERYRMQLQEKEYMSLQEGDREGPFDLAAAATKGDARMVLISSRGFAEDETALASEFAMSGQGITLRSRNPGNVTLFINSLHWLSGNTDFMNVGQPIDTAVLEGINNNTQTALRALTIFVWPALALVGGGIVWWNRRR